MAKVLFVIYLTVLSIVLINGYAQECAVGPQYWCKSFENAQDCGAIQHCTDSVWRYNKTYTFVESSTKCQWCEKILENTHKKTQELGDNEALIISTLTSSCKLLLTIDLQSKCTNIIENYGTSVISLMKNNRYATLCYLMNTCSIESSPINLGHNRCTWGPSYWCSSLNNSRECNTINHCSNQIWSQHTIENKDNTCKYCEFIIDKLRSYINENQTEINIEKWLSGACLMLKKQDLIDQCVQSMSHYADEIFILIKNNIDTGIICHLGQMCKDATIIPRKEINKNNQLEEKKNTIMDEQSKMLCNVIVRVTHELYIKQLNQNEIKIFLKNDCQKLSSSELLQKCENLVNQHSCTIYENIVDNLEVSKICDYIEDPTARQSEPHVQCELCRFVLSIAKSMLDDKQSEEKVLLYIDEHICSHLTGDLKTNCKYMIDIYSEELINNIQNGTLPVLLCSYFQVCLNEIIHKTSPIKKNEMRSFLQEHLCDHLGIFENSCHALMERDTNRLLKSLINDMEGDVLCQMFGICQTKISFIDNLSIGDDTNKCKRCIDDFARRKHIGERLLNYASEFLHHLCAQLPQKDECTKSVDESINKLIQFVQSLDPRDICTELKLCNQTTVVNHLMISSDNLISEEVTIYIKNEICVGLGPLSKFCDQLIDNESESLFKYMSKYIDPHQVCRIIDMCPTTTAFDNCNDKCECCIAKAESYQVQLAAFLQTMHRTIEGVCQHMSGSDDCRQIANEFESNINEIISHFNTQHICESLSHCSSSPVECDIIGDKCQCCQNHLNYRQNNFHEILTIINNTYHLQINPNRNSIFNKINEMNSLTACQRFGFCTLNNEQRSIPYLSNLMTNKASELSLDDLTDKFCSEFKGLKLMCEYLLIESDSSRYANIYNALLNNDLTLIDKDFNEQKNMSTCNTCKNTVESSKELWIDGLESIHDFLLIICEHCSSKDQCENDITQHYNNIKSYIDKINSEEFCQKIHLCSVNLNNNNKNCSTCIEHLKLKKDAILQGIDRLTGYFNDICQQYGEKQCQIYVKQINDLIQKSIEEFDLQQTCISIGFCGTNDILEEINFNQYEKSLEDDIEKNICSILGPFEILCKQIIHGNFNQIQTLKLNYDIKDVMKIGEESTNDLADTEDPNECSKDKCQCCIHRVIRRKRHIKFIGDMIFFALIRSCDHCPAKHECRKYWEVAKHRFDSHIDKICPKAVCIHLGFCNKSSSLNNMEDFQDLCEESLIESEKPEIIEQIDNSNSTCILCEYVMDTLSNYINSQSTEEEIEENLQKICQQMPSILQDQCYDYVDNYTPLITSILLHEFNLSTICHKINLCTNQMKYNITYITKANIETCGICDYMSTYLHFVLKSNSNKQSLTNVCLHLSTEQIPKCQILLHLFLPYIHQLELKPEKNFCQQLTICQTPMIELQPAIPLEQIDTIKPLIEPPKCTLCHYIISYLDAVLKNNKSEQAFEEALAKVCTILPGKERDQCNEFVKTYGPVLAQLIAEAADPLTVCRKLGLCQDSTNIIDNSLDIQTPHTCFICHFIINRMKYFFGLNQDKNEVFISLKASCDLYTVVSIKEQCKKFLDQHGSYFFQRISNDIEPKIACQSIGICDENYPKSTVTTSAPTSSSTKYDKCIFGMNYWCTSRENAKLCNAVELCEREVWSKKNIIIY